MFNASSFVTGKLGGQRVHEGVTNLERDRREVIRHLDGAGTRRSTRADARIDIGESGFCWRRESVQRLKITPLIHIMVRTRQLPLRTDCFDRSTGGLHGGLVATAFASEVKSRINARHRTRTY